MYILNRINYQGKDYYGVREDGFFADGQLMAGIPISVIKNAIEQEKWQKIRQKRDQLLSSSDWTQVADYPLSEAQKNAWSVYRQALRDIPEKFEVSDSIVWPEVPNA